MKYPMIEVTNFYGGVDYREMTPEEYAEQLSWYQDRMKDYTADGSSRRTKEYGDYLRRWFSDEVCDGLDSFTTRTAFHRLPMPYNVYFG